MPATNPRAYQVYDIDWKQAVRALSDTNINLASPGALVIDAVVLNPYDRVLLTAQTNATENGIYQVNAAQTYLVPAPDYINIDSGTSAAVNSGLTVTVTEGAEYAQTTWTLTTPNPIIIGTTAVTFEQVPEASDRIGNIYFDGTIIEIANAASETAISILPSGSGSDVGITIPTEDTANVASLQIFNQVTNGNVKISTTGGDWVFANSGSISGTGNVTAGYFVGDGSLLTNLSIGIANTIANGTSNVRIAATNGNITVTANAAETWTFDTAGNLSLPVDGSIVGTTVGNSGSLLWEQNGNGLNVLKLIPDDSLINLDRYLVIDPYTTGHIHIRAGGVQDASAAYLFLGGDDVHVEVDDITKEIRIKTFDVVGAGAWQFSFDNDGEFVAPKIRSGGNIQGQYFLGNGSQLTGLPASYSNASVVSYAELGWAGNIIPNANATYSLGNATNYWANLWVANNTIYIGGVPLGITAGNVLTVGGNAVLSNGSNTSISTTGNITGNYFIGNGSQLTGISSGVQSSIANGTSNVNIATANGNVTIAANASSTWTFSNTGTTTFPTGVTLSNARGPNSVNFLTGVDKSFQIETQTNVTSKLWNFTTDGNLTLPQNGNINFSNGINILSAVAGTYGNANVATFLAAYGSNTISTTGNITANYFFGSGVTAAAANSSVQLISNNENTQVRVDDANVEIYTSPNGVTQYQWSFGNNGVLGVAGNINFGGDPSAAPSLNDFASVTSAANFAIVADSANSYQTWNFDSTGNLTIVHGSQIQEVASPVPGNYALALRGTGSISPDQQLLVYPTSIDANHLHLTSGNLYNTELFLGNDDLYVKLANTGNVVVNTNDGVGNTAQYTFDSTGNLTVPGSLLLVGDIKPSGSASPAPSLSGFSSVSAVSLTASGNVTANYILGNGALLTGIAANYGNANVSNFLANGFGSNTITTTGNITAGNLIGNISITGNVTGTSSNVTLVAGSYNWTFNNTGNLTLPGNTFSVNYANNTPVDVVTRFEGSWTVPVGNSTQSFTVSPNETYYLWVDCNIPNGILTWNATATVTNTNVPVVGAQYAWVYNGGGTPIDFTSIPNQFIGTANTIVRSNVAPSSTTNRFDFGINNTSGGNVTVRYGWIQIS